MQSLRHYLLAVQFFTRIPVTGRLANWVGYSPAMLRASAAHFPGIGWLAGGLSCAVFALLHQGLGAQQPLASLVAAVLCTVATVLMTGGFTRMAWPMWPTAWAAATTASGRWTS